jgi:hypothetical protein
MQHQNGTQAVERAFFGLSKNRDTSWPGLVIAALKNPVELDFVPFRGSKVVIQLKSSA